MNARGRGVIARYRDFFPISDSTPIVSLGEGGTPLIFSPRLSEIVGRDCEVYVKYEGLNPTCSFKDRGMTVAVSKAVERGAAALICASTGNTSASAAAYAARAGIRCVVVLPAGKIASGKLVQAFAYGAKVIAIDGNFDDALAIVRKLGERDEFAIVNSINPDRIAGQMSAAFEIVDDLGDAPAFHLLPVGNAGNLTAYWAGYGAYQRAEKSQALPAMIGFQAAGAAPIFFGRVVQNPETVASAIRIGNPASWKAAKQAVTDSHGAVDIVTDAELLEAQRWLAIHEGIFVEPASAAPIAGLMKCCDPARKPAYPFAQIPTGSRIVCTVTGHGLKDPEIVGSSAASLKTIAASEEAVLRAIGS
ncbi:MAG TPA: threonine synthase [Chthoniobacterales bacterium]|jgi:threonine synthase|nr:threonine synthase [Chthoniobacterales bacterium]